MKSMLGFLSARTWFVRKVMARIAKSFGVEGFTLF
jgi:hypothetical protein